MTTRVGSHLETDPLLTVARVARHAAATARRGPRRTVLSLLTMCLSGMLVGCSAGMIEVGGGRQLYLACEGSGGPTVVMEAGGAGHSGTWQSVQPAVAEFARVCVYDRAGTGRSSSLPSHPSIQAIAEDLHALLAAADIGPPYVLVGHSIGGVIVRQFATQYPNAVVGMVLVDSSQGDQRARLQEVVTPEEWARSGMAHGDIEFPEGADLLGPDLSDIPLMVLSAGIFGEGMPPDVAERLNRVRLEMQRDLLSLSVNSTWVVAEESDHAIPQKQPELVVDAVRQVVESVRTQADRPSVEAAGGQ